MQVQIKPNKKSILLLKIVNYLVEEMHPIKTWNVSITDFREKKKTIVTFLMERLDN